MADIPLARADYHRSVPKEARIQTKNRYFEKNPILTAGGVTMISRPGLMRWLAVGEGPIRGIYSQPGSFNDALFVVSANSWYRVDKDTTVTLLTDALLPSQGGVRMTGTGVVNGTPEFMYLADGRNLFVYTELGFAHGTISGSPADGDKIQIGDVWYQFTTGDVDAGGPDGTAAFPWLVARALTDALTWKTFALAITAKGDPGVDYTTDLVEHPLVTISSTGSSQADVRAKDTGAGGNTIVTTETGAGMAWLHATLTGGGVGNVSVVETPDDVGVIALATVSSRVVVVPAQGQGINGRFYWIDPGETTIDPLNFATAESAPDPIYDVIAFADQAWFPGQSTTEVWYFTADPDNPILRLQGVAFNRGTWPGMAVQVKESMVIVDSDGGVFQISGGLNRISTPDIAERIRKAIQYQASRIF